MGRPVDLLISLRRAGRVAERHPRRRVTVAGEDADGGGYWSATALNVATALRASQRGLAKRGPRVKPVLGTDDMAVNVSRVSLRFNDDLRHRASARSLFVAFPNRKLEGCSVEAAMESIRSPPTTSVDR